MRFLCLVGPTGAGKSALALSLAQRYPLGIVNADSRQVYEAFPILTAQPSCEEQQRCSHLLYGFLPTPEKLSAGKWADLALDAIHEITQQGRVAMLVGGTGLYLRALTEGIVAIPSIDPAIKASLIAECKKLGYDQMHARLSNIDPEYAQRIHPHDRQRILRALEVFMATGKTFTWWHKQTPPPLDADILWIGVKLPLAVLEPILIARIEKMLAQGAVEEAKREFLRYPTQEPGWSGIGCQELLAWMQGKLSFAEAKEQWIHNTRSYAKRQLTWFNADKRIRWFAPEDSAQLFDFVEKWIYSLK